MALKFNPLTGKLDEYGPILTGTGTVAAAGDGTAALPGIAFASDTNTGIYRPGADQLAISTGGTGRLFVDSSGRVSINTTSPLATNGGLDISSGGNSLVVGADASASTRTDLTTKLGRFFVPHYNNSEEPATFAVCSSEATDNFVSIGGSTGFGNAATVVRFYTAANTTTQTGSERARIDSSGRLLLGTTSGTSNGRLVVSGGALFNNVNTQIISTASYVNLEVMRFLVNRGTYNEDSFAGDITVHVKAQRGASINHVSCQSLKCFVTLGAFNDFNVIRMVGEVKTIDSTTLRAGTNPGSLAVALVLESSVDGGTTWSALSATTSNDTANATALIRLRADLTGTPPTSMSAITATTSVNGLVVGNISVNSTTIAAI